MNKHKIEYRSIYMRCNKTKKKVYLDLPHYLQVVFFRSGMESIWSDIQKSVGQFEGIEDSKVEEYFVSKFLGDSEEVFKRCLFLKDTRTDTYVGTCTAYFDCSNDVDVSVLHWLEVRQTYQGKGYGRFLMSETLKVFEELNSSMPIFLHTQPSSYKAIVLYNEFGFNITKSSTYGNVVNEYIQGMHILKELLSNEQYNRLLYSVVD